MPSRIVLVHDDQEFLEPALEAIRFPEGTPNGAALARMARVKRQGIKVLFAAFPEVGQHTEGLGEFLLRPLTTEGLLAAVEKILS
jgi:hypothetical protein